MRLIQILFSAEDSEPNITELIRLIDDPFFVSEFINLLAQHCLEIRQQETNALKSVFKLYKTLSQAYPKAFNMNLKVFLDFYDSEVSPRCMQALPPAKCRQSNPRQHRHFPSQPQGHRKERRVGRNPPDLEGAANRQTFHTGAGQERLRSLPHSQNDQGRLHRKPDSSRHAARKAPNYLKSNIRSV